MPEIVNHSVWAAALAAFLGSFVEVVEAATIVLAAGTVRGWRSAIWGTACALILLVGLVAIFGRLIGAIPIAPLQFAIGLLLLLFGTRWLRKAILRAAGIVPLHDEDRAYAAETRELGGGASGDFLGLDAVGFVTAFKGVVLEGVEVVFIVLAVGGVPGAGGLGPAAAGAGLAAVAVTLVAVAVRRPLSKVPENALKFGVGVMLSAFGVFWIGEGAGFEWPGEDLSLIAIALGLFIVSLALVRMAQTVSGRRAEAGR